MLIINEALIPKKTHFMIIEDLEMVRELIKDELEELGFSGLITQSESLKESQEKFNLKKPNFILLDWTLTDGTGDKFLKAIRAHKQFNHIPILIITANDCIENQLECLNSGASGYLIKPWTTEEFSEKISAAWLQHFPDKRAITDLNLD